VCGEPVRSPPPHTHRLSENKANAVVSMPQQTRGGGELCTITVKPLDHTYSCKTQLQHTLLGREAWRVEGEKAAGALWGAVTHQEVNW
jgi:hypothetical protein